MEISNVKSSSAEIPKFCKNICLIQAEYADFFSVGIHFSSRNRTRKGIFTFRHNT